MRFSSFSLVAAALLAACGGEKVLDISVDQQGCESISEGETPESVLVQSNQGDNIVIYRDWVFISSTAEFDPEFSQDGNDIQVREYWTDEGSESSVETCFRPTITINNPDPGSFTLFWYIGDESTPFDNISIEVE